ncbi:Putative pentatricopeptide repeat-containing protein [Apostasia shenzhenica]|uniref:Pentatricopeptide repeat-containing protein n=1 Tax=Apostasia shenzhenica TaxID=1088818 RepID=A0A2I0B864_9ASPA|nr:Putative pentatricopeptide repeat-containing protein [Apostasia shenzhenica]
MKRSHRIPTNVSRAPFLLVPRHNHSSLPPCDFLRFCSSFSDLKRLHASLLTHGLELRLPLATKLISLAAFLSPSMDYARKLFDVMPHRDSYLWNTLIRGYTTIGPCEEVPPLYRDMHRMGFSPDCFTFPFVIRSCSVISAIREGKQVHCNILKNGFNSNVFAKSSLVTMYSQIGEIADSELVFGEMGERSIVSWTAMIAGYAQNSLYLKALGIFRQMIVTGLLPNEITIVSLLPACNSLEYLNLGTSMHALVMKSGLNSFVSLLNALVAMYGKCGVMEAANYLFDEMPARCLVSWNTMIAVHEQNGDGTGAIKIFRRMVAEKLTFNPVTLVSVISACSNLGALETGKWVHDLAAKSGFETDSRVSNALLYMYAKCGSISSAENLFRKLLPSKCVIAWSSMIGAYAAHGHAEEALELFSRMEHEGVTPNTFTFTSVLTACSHSGLVEEGMKHFDSMKRDYNINPTLEHCACMVDLLGRVGRPDEAYDFVKKMELKPDKAVWGALLGSCRMHGNVGIAELVVQDLLRLGLCNISFCVIMANLYADYGRWEDAARMRRKMKEQALKKTPGFSLVETD